MAYNGIYHLKSKSLRKANWKNATNISVCIYGDVATFDDGKLTRLVVLCHDRMIRLEIEGAANGYLRLLFSRRTTREGNTCERHPTIETAVNAIRAYANSVSAQAGRGGASDEV